MTLTAKTPEGLENRFTEPDGFRFHSFNRNGRTIRFGSVFPQDSIPDAVVVCLPGLSEPIEKYFETARELNKRNLAVWIIDWMGQGGSGRYLSNPHKRHSTGFDEDIEDLHYLVLEYIKHSSVHPDKGRIPMAMLAHSMGGNIGLRFMEKYDNFFECAGLSAPMLGINEKSLRGLPQPLLTSLAGMFSLFAGTSYAFGQSDWKEDSRVTAPGQSIFSNDPARDSLYMQWTKTNPDLQIGGVTFRWLYEALSSCAKARRALTEIKRPILFALAGQEEIVDNKAIRSAQKKQPGSILLEFDNAKHEILMEKDEVRSMFLEKYYQLIQKSIIDRPETLKPF